MDSPSPPPAPDPREIARTDAEFNRINQITPYGSLTFSGPNRNIATLELTPQMRGLLDQQLQSDSQLLASALERQGLLNNNPIDLSQFGPIQSEIDLSNINFAPPSFPTLPDLTAPDMQRLGGAPIFQNAIPNFDVQRNVDVGLDVSGLPEIPSNIEQFRGDVEKAVFDRGRALLDPVLADQQRALQNALANKGLPTSGEAFDRDMNRFMDARNRAFTDLANQAVVTGGNAAQQQLGNILAARGAGFGEQVTGANLNLAGGQFANQAAGQLFGQGLASGQFANQAARDQLAAEQAIAGFNNQAGLLGLGAQQGIRGQLFGEAADQATLNNQASAQNLALQQQLLGNRNAARTQALNEALGIRGNQFNELAALLGLQQVSQPQIGNFFAPTAADVTGGYALQQQALQNQFLANNNRANAFNTGLFGLGGALIGAPAGGFFSNLFT
jgi:hypothetical protein